MRKVFWCCLAAGAAVCCAFWAAAFISQNPESPLSRIALAASHPLGGATTVAHPGQPAAAEADDLIPPDPVPVVEMFDPPAVPAGDARLPPAVAALIPPIVIHDEEDFNPAPGLNANVEPPTAARVDVEAPVRSTVAIVDVARRLDGDAAADHPARPPMMPYCTDDAGPAPCMPHCSDDDDAPVMPAADEEGKVGGGMFDAWAMWMGFCSGPSHFADHPSVGRCEEDPHYIEQYPGCPYTGEPCLPEGNYMNQPPAFPGAEENSEPPAPRHEVRVDPTDLFRHSRQSAMPRPSEPKSDTMEMRPTDWKPYSLDPGPF